jgi:hypothetical protein
MVHLVHDSLCHKTRASPHGVLVAIVSLAWYDRLESTLDRIDATFLHVVYIFVDQGPERYVRIC